MIVLGIETSCDETSAAVVENGKKVLSNVVVSQDEYFKPFFGVVPEIASRRHLEVIQQVIDQALERAGINLEDVNLIAVTQKPGLIGSLLVGLSYAKALSFATGIPLVPVDHLHAHLYSAFIEENPPLPAMGIVVSGGHTAGFLITENFEFINIARTRDDAAGEALDKIAKALNLGYPGGPIIDKLSKKGDPDRFKFSFPRLKDGSFDFSFSGIKAAAIRKISELNLNKDHPDFYNFIASFQKTVIEYLLLRTREILQHYSSKSLIVAGGVARNSYLRERFTSWAEKEKIKLVIPPGRYCTDNAAMIAALGHLLYTEKKVKGDIWITAFSRTEASKGVKQFLSGHSPKH